MNGQSLRSWLRRTFGASASKVLGPSNLELASQLPAIVWTTDRQLVFTRSIGADLPRIGSSPESVVGQSLYEYFGTTDSSFPPVKAHLEALEGRTVRYSFEWRGVVFDSVAKPFYDKRSRITGIVGMAFDVTERSEEERRLRLATDEAKKANEAKTHFLADVSHELRTPLVGIVGFSDMLMRRQPADQRMRDALERIHTNARYLNELITEILDLSGAETGKIPLEPANVRVREVLGDVISIMEPRAREKNLDLGWDVAESVPEYVTTDPVRLKQILINLVGNAIAYTDRGHVRMSVTYSKGAWDQTAAEGTPDHDHLCVEVADTGCGIPEDSHDKVMEPFVRVETETKQRGTGIGLPLARRLAQALGGDLQLTSSRVGEGSVFSACIDAYLAPPPSR